ncbi:MAG TPA: Fic family protein [Gaiellaceae bacterium]
MDPARFASQRAGRVIVAQPGPTQYHAFLPARIPRELDFTTDLVAQLSRADQALGNLAALGGFLPNPHVLINPYVRREAVASTRIEGTQSSLSDVLSAEAQALPETPDRREVLNYVRALELGLERLADLPLSNRLIRNMHEELLRGVRGEERTPGEFRSTQNWIGGRGPSDAFYVPPPPAEMQDALNDFEGFLHEENQLPILIRCALLHYQFETIHPFLDGNGRLGRLLVVFYLVERGILRAPLLYLSAYFERNRDAYVESLQAVREQGAYEAWVTFFLRAAATQATGAVTTADALLQLSAEFRERLRTARARGQVVDAAEALIGNPFVSAPRLAETLGLTRQGGQYVIATLERAGIVEPAPGRSRPALFVAPEVLAALQHDEAI